jgi:hypothetical protein
MPKLTIQKKSDLTPADAFKKVKAVLNDDKDLRKLDPAYECIFDETKMSGSANGKLFKAAMTVSKQSSGSQVEIIVDLPLALALVKGVVEKTLKRKLDESLT